MKHAVLMGRIAVTGLLCGLVGFAAERPLESTLAKMDQAAMAFTDLTAELTWTHHTDVINEDTPDSG